MKTEQDHLCAAYAFTFHTPVHIPNITYQTQKKQKYSRNRSANGHSYTSNNYHSYLITNLLLELTAAAVQALPNVH